MKINILNIFSVYSGIYYQIPESMFKLLDDGQLPLMSQPKVCKKCFSRGYSGFSTEKYAYLPCVCVQKNIDKDCLKEKFSVK